MTYIRKMKRLRRCEYCNKPMLTQYSQKRFCNPSCRQKSRWERLHLRGKERVRCRDCGRYYIKVGSHAVQSHGYESAKEYRKAHGLDYKKGIIPPSHRKVLEENVRENGTINNLKAGEKYRFKKGDGRSNKIVKEYWEYKKENQ